MPDDLDEEPGVVEVGLDGLVDARVLHLHGDGAAVVRARRGGPGRSRPPRSARAPNSAKSSSSGRPRSASSVSTASSRAHRRRVGLELGQRLADRLGQTLVEVARHLAELHEGALHAPEHLGDLLRGAELELGVELVAGASAGAKARRALCTARPGARRRRRCGRARRLRPARVASRDRTRALASARRSPARFTAR